MRTSDKDGTSNLIIVKRSPDHETMCHSPQAPTPLAVLGLFTRRKGRSFSSKSVFPLYTKTWGARPAKSWKLHGIYMSDPKNSGEEGTGLASSQRSGACSRLLT